MSSRDFTLLGLREHLLTFMARAYRCVHFDTSNIRGHGDLLLRHDIDLDLESAVEIAGVEADLGMSSTYFALVTSPLYNVHAATGRKAIRELRALGHRIGLHYDPTVAGEVPLDDHIVAMRDQADALASVSEGPVVAFSLHRPATNAIRLPDQCHGMANAYAPPFRNSIAYSSDSGGWWRFGRFMDSPDFAVGRSVQLLLHPEWWNGMPDELPHARLERLLESRREADRISIAQSVAPYALALGTHVDGGTPWPRSTAELRP